MRFTDLPIEFIIKRNLFEQITYLVLIISSIYFFIKIFIYYNKNFGKEILDERGETQSTGVFLGNAAAGLIIITLFGIMLCNFVNGKIQSIFTIILIIIAFIRFSPLVWKRIIYNKNEKLDIFDKASFSVLPLLSIIVFDNIKFLIFNNEKIILLDNVLNEQIVFVIILFLKNIFFLFFFLASVYIIVNEIYDILKYLYRKIEFMLRNITQKIDKIAKHIKYQAYAYSFTNTIRYYNAYIRKNDKFSNIINYFILFIIVIIDFTICFILKSIFIIFSLVFYFAFGMSTSKINFSNKNRVNLLVNKSEFIYKLFKITIIISITVIYVCIIKFNISDKIVNVYEWVGTTILIPLILDQIISMSNKVNKTN